jgi:hypothetical protein
VFLYVGELHFMWEGVGHMTAGKDNCGMSVWGTLEEQHLND